MNNCPSCNGIAEHLGFSLLAPWLKELFGSVDNPFETSLRQCGECSLIFFSYRFSETEMNLIYSEYRGERYFNLRRRWEPWFRRQELHAFSEKGNRNLVSERQDFMSLQFKNAGLKIQDYESCLDFGGDLGQFIPKEILGTKYVCDPSESNTLEPGVVRLRNLSDLKDNVSLILNCHTLEHLVFPKVIVDEMISKLAVGGALYLEVPADRFKTSNFHKSIAYKNYLGFISRHRVLFIFLDFLTGVSRQYFRRIPIFGIIKQSEHINYFDRKSISSLVAQNTGIIRLVSHPDFTVSQGRLRLGRQALIFSKSN